MASLIAYEDSQGDRAIGVNLSRPVHAGMKGFSNDVKLVQALLGLGYGSGLSQSPLKAPRRANGVFNKDTLKLLLHFQGEVMHMPKPDGIVSEATAAGSFTFAIRRFTILNLSSLTPMALDRLGHDADVVDYFTRMYPHLLDTSKVEGFPGPVGASEVGTTL